MALFTSKRSFTYHSFFAATFGYVYQHAICTTDYQIWSTSTVNTMPDYASSAVSGKPVMTTFTIRTKHRRRSSTLYILGKTPRHWRTRHLHCGLRKYHIKRWLGSLCCFFIPSLLTNELSFWSFSRRGARLRLVLLQITANNKLLLVRTSLKTYIT